MSGQQLKLSVSAGDQCRRTANSRIPRGRPRCCRLVPALGGATAEGQHRAQRKCSPGVCAVPPQREPADDDRTDGGHDLHGPRWSCSRANHAGTHHHRYGSTSVQSHPGAPQQRILTFSFISWPKGGGGMGCLSAEKRLHLWLRLRVDITRFGSNRRGVIIHLPKQFTAGLPVNSKYSCKSAMSALQANLIRILDRSPAHQACILGFLVLEHSHQLYSMLICIRHDTWGETWEVLTCRCTE